MKGILTDKERLLLDTLRKLGVHCPPDCTCRGTWNGVERRSDTGHNARENES